MKKNLLGLAIVASMIPAAAFAKNVNNGTSSDQYILAKETSTAGTGFDLFKGQMEANIGFNMGAGTTAYARITCNAGPTEFKFPTDITVTYTDSADVAKAGYTTSAVNLGPTANALVVSIVRDGGVGTTAGLSTDRLNFNTATGFSLAKNVDKFDCTYALYDTAGDAVNGTTSNKIFTGTPETFVIRQNAYALTVAQERTLTADVNPPTTGVAYSRFVASTTPAPAVTINGPNELANGITANVGAGTVDLNGAAVTLTSLATAQTFKLTTVENVSLDGLTFHLESGTACATAGAGDLAGTMNTAKTEVTFAQTPAAGTSYRLCVSSETTEAIAIPRAQFQMSVSPTAAAGSTVSDKGPVNSGKIVYNGVTLIASIVQNTGANDFLGRVFITNKGTVARTYNVEVYNDAGQVVNTITGTLAAKTMNAIAADSLFPAGVARRGSVYFNINAPDSDIEGIYQIVNPTKGSISNAQLVRPGKN